MSREERIEEEINVATLLCDEGIWCEVFPHTETSFYIAIDGDWKHDHLRSKWIMEDNGYRFIGSVSEPSEEDWYSAKHYYRYKGL